MPNVIVALLLGILAVMDAVAAYLLNSLPRPKLSRRTLQAAVIVVVAVNALAGASIYYLQSNSPVVAGDPSNPATSDGRRSRSLAEWVADVNGVCHPAQARMAELKPPAGASTQENIAALERAADVYKVLVGDLNRLDVPSAASDSARARDWINRYNELYGRFVEVIQALNEAAGPDAGALDALIGLPAARAAKADFDRAAAAAKQVGDPLRITCPGTKLW